MADAELSKAPRMRQARKSIAHLPSYDLGGEKENATIDAAGLSSLTAGKHTAKKSRSKSIGPGSLDALKEGTGNKRESILPQVKSILKPTIPLSPPKAIPRRNASKIPSPSKSPRGKQTSPRKSPMDRSPGKGVPGSENLPNPFESDLKVGGQDGASAQSPARVAVRTEAEQQAAARERERQEMLAHREARRKSLASRRVSFAPEATLHTWNVVELPEDSTTSSASTNSTRRASGLTANAGSPFVNPRSPIPSSDASEPPSTPPEQIEEVQVAASPSHQRDLHQKKRRRSSGIPPMDFNNPNEFSSSPVSGTSDDTGTHTFETADEGSESSDSDKDLIEEESVNGIDGDDNTTVQSIGENSTGSSGRLEAALRQAANHAGTQGIDYDENGDLSMEMADDETTAAFKPWVNQGKQHQLTVGDASALLDQENINPFSPAFKETLNIGSNLDAGESIDITKNVGGVLPASEEAQKSPKRKRRKSITGGGRRRSSIAWRRSSGGDSGMGDDETMDFTTAVGGIQQGQPQDNDGSADEDDEEMTMEFTSIIGGVVQSNDESAEPAQEVTRRQSGGSSSGEEDMDITIPAGGILLPSITERTEPPEDQTMEMDITTAIGAILPEQLSTGNKAEAKILMELEADAGQLSAPQFRTDSDQTPKGAGLTDERPLPTHMHQVTMASESGSPSLATLQSRGSARKGRTPRQSITPTSHQPTPVKKPSTPSKQSAPQPTRPTTPGKTPPSKNVVMRTSSPKKLFKTEIRKEKMQAEELASTPSNGSSNALFRTDSTTGATTPSIVLKPHRRRSSGLGIDREGLGSPCVTALLDRRASIGDDAKTFVAQGKLAGGVRFEDPRILGQQVEKERADDQRRESGRGLLEHEADSQDLREDKDATANLKGMIEKLTPQKKKLKGRKSLHVGAAKGLLGKRPVELDEDEEDDTPKRLRGREGSPVKKIKLPAPPSQAATTGRITRSTRVNLAETAGNTRESTPSGSVSPSKKNTTPRDQPRFKDAENLSPAELRSFEEKVQGSECVAEPTEEEDRIHLQDFLNMTSIRFMELNTTKRRHTIAPNALEQSAKKGNRSAGSAGDGDAATELESCVVAAACTIPMLELYQHSCRELKSYISEGRKVAKEIEEATYEDNPPLFRDYMTVAPDIRSIMDNQFKNVKTNARLLSKAMWYEWRMKLLDGLREGLLTIGQGMEEDEQSLTQQEQLLQPVLPGLIEEHEKLESQVQIAQAQADELADCDQEELRDARDSLAVIQRDLEAQQQMVTELEDQLRERENKLEEVLTRKQECIDEIQEAEKIRQDCRGWDIAEVTALQDKVNTLEAAHGWSIGSASGQALSMTYNHTLELFFAPTAFLPTKDRQAEESVNSDGENAAISLTYIADAHEHHPQPLTTEKRFFIQIMRAQLQCLQQSKTRVKDLLAFVSSSWNSACAIVEEARRLNVSYITEPTITADEVMVVRSIILLRAMRTKVEVAFEVTVGSGEGVMDAGTGLEIREKSTARVCYGEVLNEKKMGEFLEERIKGTGKGEGGWVRAVKELEERLVARGRK